MTENDIGNATGAAEANSATGELFNREDRAQFDADDAVAGSAIGKMLSLFFLYTVFAMSYVAWWTYSAIAD